MSLQDKSSLQMTSYSFFFIYMNIFTCETDGPYLARVKFRKNTDDNSWAANKLVYEADSAMQEFYKTKSTQARRRGRGHSSRKNRPASKL